MWEDFDWVHKTVGIERGAQFVHGREVIVEPKTKLSKRTQPLPQEAIERLYPLRKAEGRLSGTYHVLQVARRYRDLCKKRELPYVPLSNLRTSWCTMMVNRNAPVSKVARYMGHADVGTTMRWYTRAREDELDEIAGMWGSSSATPAPAVPPPVTPVATNAVSRPEASACGQQPSRRRPLKITVEVRRSPLSRVWG